MLETTPVQPGHRRYLWTALRVMIAAAGLAYIAYSVRWRPFVDEHGVTQPGFLELLGDSSALGLLAVVGCMLPVVPLAAARWWVLLRGVGIEATYGRVLRLTWLGQFLNYAVPVGSTGGDVVRAVVAAKWARAQHRGGGPGRVGGALLSLMADRGCGLAGLVLLATLAAATRGQGDPLSRQVLLIGGTTLLGLVVTLAIYVWLGAAVTHRLGFLRTLRGVGAVADSLLDTAEAYRKRNFVPVLVAWCFALLIHIALAGAAVVAAWALGAELLPGAVFVAVPIALAAASIPLTYQGLGVMEGVAVLMLAVGDDPARTNAVFAVFLVHRLALVAVALPGALALTARRTDPTSENPALA